MPTTTFRRSFIAFHLTLGITLLVASAHTALHALAPAVGGADLALGVLAVVEAIGAALFLFPGTVRPGGLVLLLTLAVALVAHAVARQLRFDLLVYAAGTWLVMAGGARLAGRDAAVG